MTPYKEAEDMTIKRLYVALKRSDMQLLQMGAHKLHEKFHTGHKFELLDDLRQILSYIEQQPIPNDIKDLLARTINDILNGKAPEMGQNTENTGIENFQTENNYVQQNIIETNENERIIFTPKNNTEETAYQQPLEIKYQEKELEPVKIINEEISKIETVVDNQAIGQPIEEKIEDKAELNQPEISAGAEEQKEAEIQPENAGENFENNLQISNVQEGNNMQEENKFIQNEPMFSVNESSLNNVALFYDDKASFIDYAKNKKYRLELDKVSLNMEASPSDCSAEAKSIVDIPTDEIGGVLKMLNMIKGNVYFITTSKSENIIKSLIENGVNFQIPLVTKQEISGKNTVLLPLFGLSNIFVCPKCGEREYFGGMHNKVLSLQCKNCSATMYPDIYESQDFDTNANIYYWMYALNSMSKADTWILINPPLEGTRALVQMFIKSAFEISRPKKVYILSKETTKREYYKQIFKEINPNCIVKADYQTPDFLCEEFINCEMSAVKVNA